MSNKYFRGRCAICQERKIIKKFCLTSLCDECHDDLCFCLEPIIDGNALRVETEHQVALRMIKITFGVMQSLPIIIDDDNLIKEIAEAAHNFCEHYWGYRQYVAEIRNAGYDPASPLLRS